jgi:hypothetical protein
LALFSAISVETSQPLGPPDGRYLIRPVEGAAPTNVLVFSGPSAMVVFVATPLDDARAAADWLKRAGEVQILEGLAVLDRAMYAFRQIVADPHVGAPSRRQLVNARVGWGDGEKLAAGRFDDSREIPPPRGPRFQRRAKVLEPQARLAAALAGREPPLVCAELALRAGADLDAERPREAALGTMIALDAAITELSLDARALALLERVDELRELRAGVVSAAQAALADELDAPQVEQVAHALGRVEAALRARLVAGA